MRWSWWATVVGLGVGLGVVAAAGCQAPAPEGLAPTPEGGTGPEVVFDFDARPLPEVPFPIDLATRPDPDSPTGRRVNASLVAPTVFEAALRGHVDELDGFSTFAPMSVRFDAPLDVADLLARHGADLDFADDAVFLVNLTTGAPVALDIGGGAYPYVLENPARYYPNDPRVAGSNLVFETVEEDLDGDGVLDPGEDTDSDGVLDHPNTLAPGGDPVDDLLTFYERETNTLIVRPLVPLDPETRYAVVLTTRLVGEDGAPVRSPFAFVNHTMQTDDLRPLVGFLPDLGLALGDVAFCWSFTTQSTTRDLENLRMGLYGEGPYAFLADEYPPETRLEVAYDDPAAAPVNPFVVPADDLFAALAPFAGALLGDQEVVDELAQSYYDYAQFVVLGRATTALMLDGPGTTWKLDATAGTVEHSDDDLPFLLTIPKERPAEGIVKPFPVAIYVHGTGGSRLESLGFAGPMAKFGIATIGIDCYAHGLALPESLGDLFTGLLANAGLGAAATALLDNRTRDINNDGVPDPAGDFWTSDAFHTRDTIRQAAFDVVRLIHVLRGFDGTRTWSFDADGDGTPDLAGPAGDFDGDGVVDLVGPEGPYYVFGISLGGIVTSLVPAVEPSVVAAVPISTGGGLIDVTIRSLQEGVPEAVMLPTLGPLVLGLPDDAAGGVPTVALYVNDAYAEALVPVHAFDGALPGDGVRATNLRSGEARLGVVDGDLRFRVALPVDAGDPLQIDVLDPTTSAVVWSATTFDRDVTFDGVDYPSGAPLVALTSGMGLPRETPDFRRLMAVAQMAVDPGDPVNYGPHYFNDPLFDDYPGVGRPVNVSIMLSAGDMNVPISGGVTLARAAGIVSYDTVDPRFGETPDRVLIDGYVAEGLERLRRFAGPPWNDPREIILDPDNLSAGSDGFAAPVLSVPLRLGVDVPAGDAGGGGGRAVVRFLYVESTGHHGFGPSDPRLAFNVHLWAINAIGHYFATGGTDWRDDVCLADSSCEFLPTGP
jgi:hypothetical protein